MAFISDKYIKNDESYIFTNVNNIYEAIQKEGLSFLPCDIEKLLTKINDMEIMYDNIKESLIIEYANYGFVVTISSVMSLYRKRYAHAFAFAYYLLYKKYIKKRKDIKITYFFNQKYIRQKEKQRQEKANYLALLILMKDDIFLKEVKKCQDYLILSKLFKLPRVAIEKKLEFLRKQRNKL